MYRGGLRDDECVEYFGVYPCTLGTDRNFELDSIMRKKWSRLCLDHRSYELTIRSILMLPNVPAH